MSPKVTYVTFLEKDGITKLTLYFKPPEESRENVRHYVDHFLVTARAHKEVRELMEKCHGKQLEPNKDDRKIHSASLVFIPLPGQEISLGTQVHLLAMEHFSSHTTRSIHGSQS